MQPPERDPAAGRSPAARERTPVQPGGVPFDPDWADAPHPGFPAAPPSRIPTGSAAAPFTAPNSAPQPAALERRFAAFLVDYGVVLILGTAAVSVLGPVMEQWGTDPLANIPLLVTSWKGLVHGGLGWLYHAGGQSSTWQATPGKRMLGLRVITTKGKRVGFGRATVRFVLSIISAALCWIGYLAAAWDGRSQALHDTGAGTMVVGP